MSENEKDISAFNRRDFLRGGSVATMMAMLGGVEVFAQTNQAPTGPTKVNVVKLKVAVIGLGAWGREIVTTLARIPEADSAAICDTYPAALKRLASVAPAAALTAGFSIFQAFSSDTVLPLRRTATTSALSRLPRSVTEFPA